MTFLETRIGLFDQPDLLLGQFKALFSMYLFKAQQPFVERFQILFDP